VHVRKEKPGRKKAGERAGERETEHLSDIPAFSRKALAEQVVWGASLRTLCGPLLRAPLSPLK